jgi:hypothetical protein
MVVDREPHEVVIVGTWSGHGRGGRDRDWRAVSDDAVALDQLSTAVQRLDAPDPPGKLRRTATVALEVQLAAKSEGRRSAAV